MMMGEVKGSSRSGKTGFAAVHGSPGVRVRRAGMLRLFWPIVAGVFAAGYLVGCGLPFPGVRPWMAGAGILALAGGWMLLQDKMVLRLGAFFKGARGEEIVARELALLPGEFEVFHSLRVATGGRDVDHIAVGPGGVAVVETKHWTGPVIYRDGELFAQGLRPTRSPIAQVRRLAAHLRGVIGEGAGAEPLIAPVLCFAGDPFDREVFEVDGIIICNSRSLAAVLVREIGEEREEREWPRDKVLELLMGEYAEL